MNRGAKLTLGDLLRIKVVRNSGLIVIDDIIQGRHPLDMSILDPATRHIVMVAFPGVQLLDVVGPLEVFAAASEAVLEGPPKSDARGYRLTVIGSEPGVVRASSGLSLGVDRAYEDLPDEIDTLIVAGKGHEEGQTVGSTVLPFSDHAEVRKALAEMGA